MHFICVSCKPGQAFSWDMANRVFDLEKNLKKKQNKKKPKKQNSSKIKWGNKHDYGYFGAKFCSDWMSAS